MADFTKRFRRGDAGTDTTTAHQPSGNVTVDERSATPAPAVDERSATPPPPPPPADSTPATQDQATGQGDRVAPTRPATPPAAMVEERRARQREAFGGFNWGAAFFGWLVAIGLGVLLTALLGAAGTALTLTDVANTSAQQDVQTIGLGGGIALVVVGMIAYYCGGYVAGRMSRFDGARQGFGVWIFGLVATVAIAAAGWIFGDEYNVLDRLNLPRIPSNASDLTTGGLIVLGAIVLGTLLAAIVGGVIGRRYHDRVDRAAIA